MGQRINETPDNDEMLEHILIIGNLMIKEIERLN